MVLEYANGALWVLPSLAALVALVTGFTMSQITVAPGSALSRIAFQGTADVARTLLTSITSTVVTVIALVLGLTVVALQLSSTQFSPRLLRNFLRDRATQLVLSVFIATFVYSAAGLFTVGLESGSRTEEFPRLAVSGAILLLFASLGMVVFFADHLVHSIQIDHITRRVERNTRGAVDRLPEHTVVEARPDAPPWTVRVPALRSGYVQTVHPELLLPAARRAGATICVRPKLGQHVVAGTTLAYAWAPTADDPAPDPASLVAAVNTQVHLGFERTLQQDVAFGIRQLIDIASKALSAAINDPYTAVQAIDHLSTICSDLAAKPLGTETLGDPAGRGTVVMPGNTFAEYLGFICGLVSRYGAKDLTVISALLRLLRTCAEVLPQGSDRLGVLDTQAGLVLTDVEREMARPTDRAEVRQTVTALQAKIRSRQTDPRG